MAFWTNAPFVLFVLVELDHEVLVPSTPARTRLLLKKERQTINKVLRDAKRGTSVPDFWLATDNYSDAPEKRERHVNLGTEPPMPDDYTSQFIGMKVEDAA